MRIGIDDTDSPAGMCTTYLGAVLADRLSGSGMTVRDAILVRLNPNVIHKTRGNAAICLDVTGDPAGPHWGWPVKSSRRWPISLAKIPTRVSLLPFLNRVDEIVIFNPLSEALLREIVDIQVARMKKYLLEKKIDIVLTDRAKEHLAKAGYDPVYGARPLKRAIQKEILNPLALKLLDGTFGEGDLVAVEYADDRIVFHRRAVAEAVS